MKFNCSSIIMKLLIVSLIIIVCIHLCSYFTTTKEGYFRFTNIQDQIEEEEDRKKAYIAAGLNSKPIQNTYPAGTYGKFKGKYKLDSKNIRYAVNLWVINKSSTEDFEIKRSDELK